MGAGEKTSKLPSFGGKKRYQGSAGEGHVRIMHSEDTPSLKKKKEGEGRGGQHLGAHVARRVLG